MENLEPLLVQLYNGNKIENRIYFGLHFFFFLPKENNLFEKYRAKGLEFLMIKNIYYQWFGFQILDRFIGSKENIYSLGAVKKFLYNYLFSKPLSSAIKNRIFKILMKLSQKHEKFLMINLKEIFQKLIPKNTLIGLEFLNYVMEDYQNEDYFKKKYSSVISKFLLSKWLFKEEKNFNIIYILLKISLLLINEYSFVDDDIISFFLKFSCHSQQIFVYCSLCCVNRVMEIRNKNILPKLQKILKFNGNIAKLYFSNPHLNNNDVKRKLITFIYYYIKNHFFKFNYQTSFEIISIFLKFTFQEKNNEDVFLSCFQNWVVFLNILKNLNNINISQKFKKLCFLFFSNYDQIDEKYFENYMFMNCVSDLTEIYEEETLLFLQNQIVQKKGNIRKIFLIYCFISDIFYDRFEKYFVYSLSLINVSINILKNYVKNNPIDVKTCKVLLNLFKSFVRFFKKYYDKSINNKQVYNFLNVVIGICSFIFTSIDSKILKKSSICIINNIILEIKPHYVFIFIKNTLITDLDRIFNSFSSNENYSELLKDLFVVISNSILLPTSTTLNKEKEYGVLFCYLNAKLRNNKRILYIINEIMKSCKGVSKYNKEIINQNTKFMKKILLEFLGKNINFQETYDVLLTLFQSLKMVLSDDFLNLTFNIFTKDIRSMENKKILLFLKIQKELLEIGSKKFFSYTTRFISFNTFIQEKIINDYECLKEFFNLMYAILVNVDLDNPNFHFLFEIMLSYFNSQRIELNIINNVLKILRNLNKKKSLFKKRFFVEKFKSKFSSAACNIIKSNRFEIINEELLSLLNKMS